MNDDWNGCCMGFPGSLLCRLDNYLHEHHRVIGWVCKLHDRWSTW